VGAGEGGDVSLRMNWNVLPAHDRAWTVWSEALVDPVSLGDEEHAKSCIRDGRVKVRGVPDQFLRSPAGVWYRWDGSEFVLRPEGGAVRWCDLDDCPAVSCPLIPWPGPGSAICLA
jgi:hypothetical protein